MLSADRYGVKKIVKRSYLTLRKIILQPFSILVPKRVIDKKRIKKVLFLRHDRIGDMALSLPAIKLLKQSLPHATITVLASKSNKDLLINNSYVDEVLVYSGILDYIKKVWGKGFDLVIDPIATYELKTAFMAFLSRAYYRLGFEWAGREIFFSVKAAHYDPKKHFKSLMIDLLRPIGVIPISDEIIHKKGKPLLIFTKEEREKIKEIINFFNTTNTSKKKTIAIHPGGFYPSQRWPIDRFVEVAKDLTKKGFCVLFFLPEKEFPKFNDSILKNINNLQVIKKLPLRSFMALLSYCELMICNNSGPLHIAVELGIKTVSTMGPTVPDVWMPKGPDVWMPKGPDVWMPKGPGHIILRKGYPCSPCNKPICQNHKCMLNITVKELLEKTYIALI